MQSLKSKTGGGQAVLAIIAVICIGVAGYFIIRQSKIEKESLYGDTYYYCTNCKKEFVDSSDKVPPIRCPSCGQMTAASLRKYKCKQCGGTFRGYIQKFDPETKRLIEKRKRGEEVPDAKIGSELLSEAEEEYWVDGSSQEAFDILNNISCPKCQATGADIEPIFPKSEKKK